MKTPSKATAYATEDELVQAIGELRTRAGQLATDAKTARKQAREVHPLFDFRPRSRTGRSTARTLLETLPPDAREIVNRAVRLVEHRNTVSRAADSRASPNPRFAHPAVIAAIDPEAAGENCTTFHLLVDRWQCALEGNGETMMTAKEAAKRGRLDDQAEQLLRRIDQLRGVHVR